MAIDINIPIEDAVTDGSLNPVTSNAVFDALSGLASPTLQAVTDTGNTTNKDIAFIDNAGILLENSSRLREGTIDSGAKGGIAQICAVGYELKWEVGSQYVMEVNGTLIREVNHKFNIIPDANNDETQGFYVGSRWILDNGDVYVCTDSTSTAAVWEKLPSVSDLVPYKGATADVDLGTNSLSTEKVFLYDGANDNFGSIHYTDGNFHIEDADGHPLIVVEDGFVQIHKDATIQSNLYTSGLTAIRDHYLPDASGTLALTSDIPTVDATPTDGSANAVSSNGVFDGLASKQATLVSGTNIKTVNSTSLLGSGNVAVQPTLVSGTNIKTVNGNSLLGSGDITVGGGGITVGTTAVTSGTVGRVFFQGTGNVVQQSSSLFWDNTNSRLGVGATTAGARLDVGAQGALSTDIVQRWRNSADTANLGMITGNGAFTIGTYTNPSTQLTISSQLNFGMYIEGITGISAANQPGSGSRYAIQALGRSNVVGATAYGIRTGADSSSASTTNYGIQAYAYNGTTNYAGYFDSTGGTTNYALYIQRGDILFGNAATNKIAFWNKTPIVQPTTAIAAATFVPNLSGILNDSATFDGYTIGQVVKALRNIGILA